jgi:pyruvate dehydrogenase E2 component (dihydrolipoamide acetyltransferase)
MPSLGADVEAGTPVEWVRHAGDAVKRGDIIAVVDTQKGAIEIEVFEDGVIEQTVVELGRKVPVGTVLAIIRSSAPEPRPPPSAAVSAPPESGRAPAPTTVPGPSAPATRPRISPMARKVAADLGVDLAQACVRPVCREPGGGSEYPSGNLLVPAPVPLERVPKSGPNSPTRSRGRRNRPRGGLALALRRRG